MTLVAFACIGVCVCVCVGMCAMHLSHRQKQTLFEFLLRLVFLELTISFEVIFNRVARMAVN